MLCAPKLKILVVFNNNDKFLLRSYGEYNNLYVHYTFTKLRIYLTKRYVFCGPKSQ